MVFGGENERINEKSFKINTILMESTYMYTVVLRRDRKFGQNLS